MARRKSSKGGLGWLNLVGVSLAALVVSLSLTALFLALPQSLNEYNTSIYAAHMVAAVFGLVTATLVLPMASLAQVTGRRTMLIAGLVLMAGGAVTASYADELVLLFVGWSVIAGIGASAVISQLLHLVRVNFPKKQLANAYTVLGGALFVGLAAGPSLGSLVADEHTIDWVFRSVAIASALAILTSVMMKEEKRKKSVKLDYLGLTMAMLGTGLLVIGLILSQEYGFITPRASLIWADTVVAPLGFSISISMIVLSFVLLAASMLRAKKQIASKKPAVYNPELMKNRELMIGLKSLGIASFVAAAAIFTVSIIAITMLNVEKTDRILALLPFALATLFVVVVVSAAKPSFKRNQMIGAAFVLAIIGLLLIDTVVQIDMTAGELIPGLVVLGLAVGIIATQIISSITDSVSKKGDVEEASTMVAKNFALGSTLGVTAVGIFVLIGLTYGFGNALADQGLYDAQSQELLATAVQVDAEELSSEGLDELLLSVPGSIADEINDLKTQADIDTYKSALGLLVLVSAAGMLSVFELKKKK